MNQDLEKLGKEIQQSFSLLLKEYLPKNLLEKAKENKSLKIISIACGKFLEAECLFECFSSNDNQIKLFGIEIDKDLFNSANERLFSGNKKDQISLKCGDATSPENYEEWIKDGLFDLIIIRHPEITFNTDVFMKIFSNCKTLLLKEGFIFVTTHHENEKRAVEFLFKILDFNIVLEVENQGAASSKKGDEIVYADKYLLIGNNSKKIAS